MSENGYVYILTNPSFKEDWVKIGKSSRPVDVRSKELDNTSVPLPFEIFATLQTSKFSQVEKLIHKTIDRLTSLRIRQNREFFNVSPDVALSILNDIASTLDDAVIDEVYYNRINSDCGDDDYQNEPELTVDSFKQRVRFSFKMVRIDFGSILTFIPKNIDVKVANDDMIEYDGRLYRLSSFVGTFMPEDRRNRSGVYKYAAFFRYKGELLSDIRERSGYNFFDSSSTSEKNNDRYIFDGGIYNKGELVNKVIKAYVDREGEVSYNELEREFPRIIQGSCGCFDSEDVAYEIYQRTGYKRHRLKNSDVIELSEGKILTSNQWGQGNIGNFIKNAKRLGFFIEIDK